MAGVDELTRDIGGDILVFLPTERDIRDTAAVLNRHAQRRDRPLEILPLYARLPAQGAEPGICPSSATPRVVLATNVAESSLTVPGIRAVIDTGTARISRYSPRSKVQRLPIEAVSRARPTSEKGGAAASGRASAFGSTAKTIIWLATRTRHPRSAARIWHRSSCRRWR